MQYKPLLKNNLENSLLEDVADGRTIYGRGQSYYRAGYVEKESICVYKNDTETGVLIEGDVEGGDTYESSLYFDLEEGVFDNPNCDCPYGMYCKHSVALGFEFIDLYLQFLKQTKIQKSNFSLLREWLINFINKGEIDSAGIIDAEYEDIDNKAQARLQELASLLGVDINKLPKKIVEQAQVVLSKDAKSYLPSVETKTQNQPQIPSQLSQGSLKEITRSIIDKYYITIDFKDSIEISIKISAYCNRRPTYILNYERENLTDDQEKLFKFLEHNSSIWHTGNLNLKKFFYLLKNSGMKFYRKTKSVGNEIIFQENPEKIKAEFFKREDEFIFKIDDKYKPKLYGAENDSILYRGTNNCLTVEKNIISFHELSKKLTEVISCINFSHHYYDDRALQTVLDESDILKPNYLNNIIKDGAKYLDFETELEPKYNVIKFDDKKAKNYFLIDYNAQEDTLDVKAAIDYGFTKQDVSETNYYASRTYGSPFRRRDNAPMMFFSKIDGYNISYSEIQEKKEMALFKKIHKNDYGFNKRGVCSKKGQKEISNYYETYWPIIQKIKGAEIEFLQDEFNFGSGDFKADFDVDFNADNDWLAFDVKCYCGDDKIKLEDLKKYVENKDQFVKMADGRMLKITNWNELERFILMLESFYAKENDKFEGKIYHAPELEDIVTSSKYYNAKVSEGFDKFMKEARSGKPVKKVKLLAKFDSVLRDYQKEGVDWFYFLRKYRFAGVLADDMGLGKTLQTLTLIDMNKVKDRPSIVVCPKTLLYNWQDEVNKFTPKIKAIVLDGPPLERKEKINKIKNHDLAITSYATMQKDAEVYEKENIKFNYCILDEAQNIKNHATKNARIVKKIDADYRLALTGTPLENSVSEIWSVFDFLMPGFLGSNKAFVKKFQNPIMKKSDISALKNLRKKTSVFMLRRTKDKVLKELPPKVEQVSHCQLDKSQNILYQEILANVKSDILNTVAEKGFAKSQIHILAGLTKLRQVCNHPVLLLKDKDYTKYESAKLNLFLELVREITKAKRKVLVFSQFTKMLDILASELKKEYITYSYLSGKTKNRQTLVKDFNESDEKQVFLISLKAGGTGLNLTSADNVIIFDPWWNPSVEMQAVDRAHRIGQKKSVNVYRLITKGTIEDKIVALQEKKKFLFDNMVGESQDMFKKLTWSDVKELFR